MISKTVAIRPMNSRQQILDDLRYWRSKEPEERVAAVDFLRTQYYGSTGRLQRTARVVKVSEK